MLPRPVSGALTAAAGVAVLVGGLLGAASPAAAAPAVTTTADGGAGSLRAAVLAANASGAAETIDLPPGTYALTRCGADDTGANGDLDLTTAAAVTLRAPSGGVTIRQTCAGERVLQSHAAGGRTVLQRVTVTGGSVTGAAGAAAEGGGLWVRGDLALLQATVTGNAARGGDGAAATTATATPGAGGAARGGGVWAGGSLVATSATIGGNTATGGAGGATLPGSTVTGVPGGAAEGGGAYVGRAVAVVGGRIQANTATGGGGGAADGARLEDGVERVAPGGGGGAARGGGIAQAAPATSPVALTGVRTTGNTAAGGGIGQYRIFLNQSPVADYPAAGTAAGGAVAAAGPLAAAGVTASADRALGGSSRGPTNTGVCGFICNTGPASGAARGGALHAAGSGTVAGSTFDATSADSGEALLGSFGRFVNAFGYPAGQATGGAVDAGGDLRLLEVTVTGSRARNGAGFPLPATAAAGGAAHSGATITVARGTFSGNVAGRGTDSPLSGAGGAIAGATVRLTDAALSGNTAATVGGGAWSAGALNATRTQVLTNAAGRQGGGIAAEGDVTLVDSRVHDNDVNGTIQATTGSGGGVRTGALVSLTRTSVTDNTGAVQWRAVIPGQPTLFLAGDFRGGGVHGGRVVAVDSTVAGNNVTGLELGVTSPDRWVDGAGIYAESAAELTNTTVHGNRLARQATSLETDPSPRGGGVRAPTLRLVHATVTDNAVTESGPSVPARPAATAGELSTTEIVAVGTVVVPAAGQRSCVAGATSPGGSSYDVFGDTTCNVTGAGVLTTAAGVTLGPLADNGGPVPTRLPGPGDLLDVMPPAACGAPADARGVTRPQGPGCDIGAVEVARTS
jgi:hypothetical protein